jgi:hypothetical protein
LCELGFVACPNVKPNASSTESAKLMSTNNKERPERQYAVEASQWGFNISFINMHHFSPWHSKDELSSAHLAYRNGQNLKPNFKLGEAKNLNDW